MLIQDLIDEAHATAIAKGWHETPRTTGTVIALIHSELSEALEEVRDGRALEDIRYPEDGKPEGFVVEIADVMIRIFDVLGSVNARVKTDLHLHDWCAMLPAAPADGDTVGDDLAVAHGLVSAAYARARAGFGPHDRTTQFKDYLLDAVQHLGLMCAYRGLDIENALRVKMDFNKTRPHRHGGKAL
jgi:hypothetical protein